MPTKNDATFKAVGAYTPSQDEKSEKSYNKGDEISAAEYEKLPSHVQSLFIASNNPDANTGYGQKTEADKANAAGSLLTGYGVPDLAGGLREGLVPVKDDTSGNIHFEHINAPGNEDLKAPAQQPDSNDVAVSTEHAA